MRNRILAALMAAAIMAVAMPHAAAAGDTFDVGAYTRDDEIGELKLSPDGRFYAAAVPAEGRSVLVLVRRDGQEVVATFSLGKNSYVYDFDWVNPTRVIVGMSEKIGLLDNPAPTGNLYAVDAAGGPPDILVGQDVNEMSAGSRIRRKEAEHVAAFLLDELPDDDRHVLIQVSGFSGDSFSRVEKMDVYSGHRQRVARGPVRNASFTTDPDGVVRFASGWGIDNSTQLYYRAGENAEWTLLNDEAKSGLAEWPLGFSADGSAVFLQVERPDGPDAVVAMDPASGKRVEVVRDGDTDPMAVIRGERGAPIGVLLPDGRTRSIFFDPDSEDALTVRMLEKAFKEATVRVTSRTKDGSLLAVEVASDRNAGDFYIFDVAAKNASYMISRRSWLDPETMAAMQPVSLQSRDGLALRGYLTVPRGSGGKGLPLVVLPHGGPYGIADTWGFDPTVQMLAAAGYGVLQVNFRGSPHHGRAFQQAGAREWGKAMQDDLTDATRWAVTEGIANPERICIFGASYGGYAALMGVAREPDLYRCAVGYVGVYDLPLMYSRGDVRETRSSVSYMRDWIGERDTLAAVSPVHLADRIKAPVFLAAGGEDERAPIEHSRRMERALREAGVPVETLYYETEGHGFHVAAHRREFNERLLAFLGRHLGPGPGAGQAGGTDAGAP